MKHYGKIMAGFTKTIKALDNLTAKNDLKIGTISDSIAELNVQVYTLQAEANAASSTADKLKKLVG